MADEEELSRAEALAKKAMELSARAEELARQAHEVAGVDEQLAALEADLDALSEEEALLDSGVDEPPRRETPVDSWMDSLSQRMELLGYRVGELVSGSIDAALQGRLVTGIGTEGELSRQVAGALPVRVSSRGGGIDVKAGQAGRVWVQWRGRHLPALADGEQPVTVTERDGVVFIETRPLLGWRFGGVHLDVEVPPGSAVDAGTGGGSVQVQGTHGPVKTNTGGGSIHISGADGPVVATTGGGSIHFEGRPSGDSILRTGGGSIEAVLAPGTTVDLDVKGSHAVIDVAGTHLKGTHITGSVGGGGGGLLAVRTGGGAAHVRQAGG